MATKGPIKGNPHLHEEIEIEESIECNCGAPCEGETKDGFVFCANCHQILRRTHGK